MGSDTPPVKLAYSYTAKKANPDIYFGPKGALLTEKIACKIQQLGLVCVGPGSKLYRYHKGVFLSDGEAFARVETRRLLGPRCKKSHFGEVVAWLRAAYPTITVCPPAEVINVQNGLLYHETLELRDHSPTVHSIIQLPVNWVPDATCPLFDKFLAEVVAEDAIYFVFEIIGTAIYSGNPFRASVLLLGPGKNGKSVLLNVVQCVLGQDNVSSVPLQTLTENRFAAAELFGKLANICGDLDSRAVKSTGAFKMITGGDLVYAERKYGQPFKFTSIALPLFSANEAPMSADQTQAWFDRWLIIPMERRIKDDEVDPHLTKKLTTPSELEGILVKAVAGLRRALDRGCYEIPPSVERACAQFREQLDTISSFIAECCVINPDKSIARPLLYTIYREYCKDSGRPAISAQAFNGKIRELFGDRIIEGTKNGGQRVWKGIST